jgi:hypothetical protein
MAVDTSLLELNSTRLHLALPTKCSRTTFSPSPPGWPHSRPLQFHTAPAHRPLLGTEAGPAIDASAVAIRVVATVDGLYHFCSSVAAIWTTHRNTTPSFESSALAATRPLMDSEFDPWPSLHAAGVCATSLDFLQRVSARMGRRGRWIDNAKQRLGPTLRTAAL